MSDAPTPPSAPTPPEPPAPTSHGYDPPPTAPGPAPTGPGYYPPATPHATPPNHEHAGLALGLGIGGLVGGLFFGLGLLMSPFALGFGISALRAMGREPGRWGGGGMATAGIVLGAIGTLFLVLGILILGAFVAGGIHGYLDATQTGVNT